MNILRKSLPLKFNFSVPEEHESLLQFGASSEEALPEKNVKVLIWNVYKGKLPTWEGEFRQIIQGHDLVLLQEAITDQKMPKVWCDAFNAYAWNMAASFHLAEKQATGVAIGSRVHAHDLRFVRTKDRELFVLTPKIALLSQFNIKDRKEKLLVVNIHSLNFTTTAAFIKSVEEKIQQVDGHLGPVIVAGDFNTWNFKRWILLVQILSQMDLYPVEFTEDPRVLKLDHIFVRGIDVHQTRILHGMTGSDHFPLEVFLSFT